MMDMRRNSHHSVEKKRRTTERGPVHAGKLRALIRVDQHLVFRFASPHRHEQRLQYDVRGLSALHCPADDPARIEVDDNRKVSETFAGSNVSDVRDPGLVRSCYVELPVELIIDDDDGLPP